MDVKQRLLAALARDPVDRGAGRRGARRCEVGAALEGRSFRAEFPERGGGLKVTQRRELSESAAMAATAAEAERQPDAYSDQEPTARPATRRVRRDIPASSPRLPPLERTGGGPAARRCCFALLPLGIRRKSSRLVGRYS
jgi:hypothetical protein